MVMVRLPVLLCISFCFALGVSIMSMQLGLLCNDDGLCEWKRNTLYNGCLSEDVTVLKFVYFVASSHAVLSCTSVQVVYIEYTEMTCNEISAVFTTLRPLSVQISGTSCEISPYLTTDMHRGSTKGVEITHYHTTDHKITSQEAEDKFSTLPWPTTQSPQSSSTQASTVGVKSTSHPTTVTTEKSAKTTDEHEEGISSTVTILIIISLCLSAIVLCGCLCLVLVRHNIRKTIQREHIENIDSALSSYSVVDSESEL